MKNLKISIFLAFVVLLNSSLKAMDTKQNQLLKKVVIGTYISTLLTEIALTASPTIQSMIFGNGPIDEVTKNYIASLANTSEITSLKIQQAYPFWHKFVSAIFSNHSTLFIDPTIDLNNETMDSIKKTLVAIEYKRDRNILIAAIAIPTLLYGTLEATSFLLKKISPPNNSFLGSIKLGIDYLSQNFTLSSLIALTTVLGFIKIQDYYLATR